MLINQAVNALKPSLAILDWGIGGMDFYRIFKKNYPKVGLCYFSDAGNPPYGKQQRAQLALRLCDIVEFLRQQGISHLVVACNAMSTVLPYWSLSVDMNDFQLTGVIEPTISAIPSMTS